MLQEDYVKLGGLGRLQRLEGGQNSSQETQTARTGADDFSLGALRSTTVLQWPPVPSSRSAPSRASPPPPFPSVSRSIPIPKLCSRFA